MGKTRKAQGTVRQLGIEGGVWALVTDEGETIELLDAPPGLLKNGARAEVELDGENADVTIGMTGASGHVRSHRIL
ncbi:MAG: hypothetical protein M3Y87_06820 [Myxococcota bacterium]|nr:hypothetical protein [Myxococcota bacterium]